MTVGGLAAAKVEAPQRAAKASPISKQHLIAFSPIALKR